MVVLKGTDLFQRQHHNDILSALRSLDGELLLDAECYFAGDTAIVLNLDEYRESVDIDFLCASQEGYRIPNRAWTIAEGAYGETVRKAYAKAVERIRNPNWLRKCMVDMAMNPGLEDEMNPGLEDEMLAQHGGPLDPEESTN